MIEKKILLKKITPFAHVASLGGVNTPRGRT